ncbi:MAG: hypothetical protein ABIP77_03945 [Candidatus Limnocylindrales bacterium]
MSRQGSVSWRGAQVGVLLAATVAIVVALALQRAGSTGGAGGSASPPIESGAGASGGSAGPSGAPTNRLPLGLEDRGWIAETAGGRFIAGTLSGRVLALPADEHAITSSATAVVSVRYAGSARSTIRVRDFVNGRMRVSVDRPGTISSALLIGDSVYVTGDDGSGSSDPGVQAISLSDGAVRDVIPAGAAPADMPRPVSRSQLRLSASGTSIGSPICSGDLCTVDVVDIATGARTTPLRNTHGFLIALGADLLYLLDDLSTTVTAVDAASGAVRWSIDDGQIGGVLPTADGARVVVSYLPNRPNGGPLAFRLASADTASGSLILLVERPADVEVPSFFPALSNDRFAVISAGGTLSDALSGIRRRIALTLVDSRSGVLQPDAVTLTAP